MRKQLRRAGIFKITGVVEDRFFEDEAVGNAHNAPAVLVAVDPLADLHQGGSEQGNVDHIALDAAQLHPVANFVKAGKIIRELYEYFCANPEKLWELKEKKYVYDKDHNQIVCDFIAGMTDSFAISLYEKLFLPKRWSVEFSK